MSVSGENLIVDINCDEVEFEDWDDGSGWLAALAPLRAEVLAGDLRLFYLLWLTAVHAEVFEADRPEPMPGIGPMSASLEAFAEFFGIDSDLVQAAAERPTVATASAMSAEAVRGIISAMTDADKTTMLSRLFDGDPHVAAEHKRRVEEAEKARQARLLAIARRGEGVWREVEAEIERRNAAAYDKAAGLLLDLQAVAKERGTIEDFLRRLHAIREKHVRKERFIERLATLE